MSVLTEATLSEIHGELAARLKMAHGKPLMICISFKDDNDQLQHWMGLNNEYSYSDTVKTVTHYVTQTEKDFKPANEAVVQDMKQQFSIRRKAKLRG